MAGAGHPAAMIPLGLCVGGGGFDPLLVLLLGLALDAALGDLPWLFRFIPHPIRLLGTLIDAAEKRLNRPQRSEAARFRRGAGLLVVLVAGAAGLGWAAQELFCRLRYGWALEAAVVAVLVAQRSLFDAVRRVGLALAAGGLKGGREAVAHIVGRDPARLDEHGVARAAIESCAENFSDAVVAPVFWTVLLGLPGLLAYKTVNTLDSMIGYRNERFAAFGQASARFDDLVNLVPARLAGLLLVVAALFAPRARPLGGLRTMLADARNHRSPNSGWPEAAMAGALDLSLAGPRHYPQLTVNDKWIGEGRARATVGDIRRALYLYAVACLLNAGLVILVLWLKYRG